MRPFGDLASQPLASSRAYLRGNILDSLARSHHATDPADLRGALNTSSRIGTTHLRLGDCSMRRSRLPVSGVRCGGARPSLHAQPRGLRVRKVFRRETKMKALKVLALTAVLAAVLAFVNVPGQIAQTQRATEAPTGFDGRDNGFLAEFCARQAELARESPLSPAIPDDECNMEAAVEEFTGPETAADGLGPIFNASRLRRMPHRQPDPWRHQPDHRDASGLLRPWGIHGPSGRITDPLSDAPGRTSSSRSA